MLENCRLLRQSHQEPFTIYFILFVASFMRWSEGITCYTCGSKDTCPAEGMLPNNTCEGNMCSKSVIYAEEVEILKNCLPIALFEDCRLIQFDVYTSLVCICDADFCNGSPRLSPTPTFFLVLLAVAVKFKITERLDRTRTFQELDSKLFDKLNSKVNKIVKKF